DEDADEDANTPSNNATFTVNLVSGETITGNLTLSHGVIFGSFTWNGTVYTFRGDQESSFNHLANISTRAFVNTGMGQLIGGFIIRGGPKLVLIRALGPTLTASGVSPVLADPKLQLFQDQTLLRENDNWQSAANAAATLSKVTGALPFESCAGSIGSLRVENHNQERKSHENTSLPCSAPHANVRLRASR